ncbi:hypothetical protein L1987_01444 [Smallanthus sonchifolius]|uniref:Uncharacterized protein n=1 Tax=Smallanthus sonchifolius TaxID=185202 RepID=A0ACB9K4W4_9ASTR|nr:hypothetical protein L1987_01444 [Smallanthus sonchifolius]
MVHPKASPTMCRVCAKPRFDEVAAIEINVFTPTSTSEIESYNPEVIVREAIKTLNMDLLISGNICSKAIDNKATTLWIQYCHRGITAVKDGAPLLGGGSGVVLPEVEVGGDDGLELGEEVGGQGSVGRVGVVVGGDAGVIGAVDGGLAVGGEAGVVGAVAEAETLMVNF